MEFRYSDELPASEHPTAGMARDIPVRRHRSSLREDIGALRAQQDWREFVGPLKGFRGGLSYKYGLMQVAVPECRPERLEVIAYASELGFLYDDCTEFLDQEELERANDNMQLTFSEGVQHGKIDANANGLKAMQAALLKEMMAIDRPRALTAMKVWIEFLQEAAGRQHKTMHVSFHDYMNYRMLDVGEMFWLGLVTFGMALTIPEADMPLLRKLTRPCWVALALQNDVCSYSKESEAARAEGASHIVNAVWVIMYEEGTTLEHAIDACKQHIDTNVAEYQAKVEAHRNDGNLSKDTRIYLESLLYTISGDAAWSLITPRYNFDQTYNDLQLSMLEKGVDAALADLGLHSYSEMQTRTATKITSQANMSVVSPEVLAFEAYTNAA